MNSSNASIYQFVSGNFGLDTQMAIALVVLGFLLFVVSCSIKGFKWTMTRIVILVVLYVAYEMLPSNTLYKIEALIKSFS